VARTCSGRYRIFRLAERRRSLLFCPANEPRKVARLAQSGADAIVLDLEDAVADAHKIAGVQLLARRSTRSAA
jgi:citrate lyase subunit beta / citryl-CoA lyase